MTDTTQIVQQSAPGIARSTRWIVLLLGLCCLVSCGDSAVENVTLSEKPATRSQEDPGQRLQPQISELGMRLRMSYQQLNELARRVVPESQSDEGSQRFCERVIGIKVCGTTRWVYRIQRTGDVVLSGVPSEEGAMINGGGRVAVSAPLTFDGEAGMQGDLAKALNLSKVDFSGAVDLTVMLGIDLDEQWCPVITTEVSYQWTQSPRVEWIGGIDFNVQEILDKKLAEEMGSLDERLAGAIDCKRFRDELQQQWRAYSIAIDLPAELNPELAGSDKTADGTEAVDNKMFLNLVPQGFAFSGVNAETDRLGISFVLEAQATVDTERVEPESLQLPALKRVDYRAGSTRFDFLLNLDYKHIRLLAVEALANQEFKSTSVAGDVSVLIHDVSVSGSGDRLSVELDFEADLPGRRTKKTTGKVYLTALPVVNADTRTLSLTDLRFSSILDSKLWDLLASVFEGKIVSELQSRASIDLGPHLTELEITVLAQLADENNTRGAIIDATDLTIDLVNIIPTTDALALNVRASSMLDIQLPVSVFEDIQ